MSAPSIAAQAPWLAEPTLRKLLDVLGKGGEAARVAGGAVRNALLGEPVADIDIATTLLPDETARRAKAAGFKPVPTGIEHGTVTVVAAGRPYEVTTLRADIETDGRHAKVRFGRDWRTDAERRDFTINALYADPDGTVIDLVDGLADIETRTVRFIGEADRRIAEDFLRILRFFRFFAWYGRGRPDAEGLRACARLKDGLDGLSAERVRAELKKLLAAPDPARALLWMRQAGVLSRVLPESDKWGIDAIHGLVAAEDGFGWPPDPLLRLQAIVPPDAPRMAALAKRLRMSKAEAARLSLWAMAETPGAAVGEGALAKSLYRGDAGAIRDRIRHALAADRVRAENDPEALARLAEWRGLLKAAERWQKPRFPLAGADLVAAGHGPGPGLGKLLTRLENEWIDGGFRLTRDELLRRAGPPAQGG